MSESTHVQITKQKSSDQTQFPKKFKLILKYMQWIGRGKNHLTGRPCLTIPDFATAILSKEPPSASRCSSPTVVMIDKARSEPEITLVASRAPPNPAYMIGENLKR